MKNEVMVLVNKSPKVWKMFISLNWCSILEYFRFGYKILPKLGLFAKFDEI